MKIGIIEQLKQAKTKQEVDNLLTVLATYKRASEGTKRKCLKIAKARLIDINKEDKI